jgi:hypothetical protein
MIVFDLKCGIGHSFEGWFDSNNMILSFNSGCSMKGMNPDLEIKVISINEKEYTEAQRAEWLVYVVQYTAEELGMSIVDTTELLAKHGFIEKTLNGYPTFHTQGFEYMAEFLTGELHKVRGTKEIKNA